MFSRRITLRSVLTAVLGAALLGAVTALSRVNVEYWARANGYDAYLQGYAGPVMDRLATVTQSLGFLVVISLLSGGVILLWAELLIRKWRETVGANGFPRLWGEGHNRKLMAMTFAFIFGALFALTTVWALLEKSPSTNAAAGMKVEPIAINTETRLRLEFGGVNTLPVATDLHNIWRWYTLLNITVLNHTDGTTKELKTRTLFLTLETPIDIKQVLITRVAGILPRHEVKDTSARSVVIVFLEDVVDATLDVRLVTTPVVTRKSDAAPRATTTILASEFRPCPENGAKWDTSASGLALDPSYETRAECELVLPEWAQDQIQFRVNWSHPSTTTNFGAAFGLRGKLAQEHQYSDIGLAFGQIDKTGERHWTNWSEATNLSRVLPDDLYQVQLYRAVADLRDTMAVDATVHAIQIRPAES
jgi:hypothetical protein